MTTGTLDRERSLRVIPGGRGRPREPEAGPRSFLLGKQFGRDSRPCLLTAADRTRLYVSGGSKSDRASVLARLLLHDLCAGSLTAARSESAVLGASGALLITRDELLVDQIVGYPRLTDAQRDRIIVVDPTAASSAATAAFAARYLEQISEWTKRPLGGECISDVRSACVQFVASPTMLQFLTRTEGLCFDDLVDGKRVVLLKLPPRYVGPEDARMLTELLLRWVLGAAKRRKPQRTLQFHVYVDDADELAGPAVGDMISWIGVYGVGITLANQSFDALPKPVRAMVYGLMGTFVSLRQSKRDAAYFGALGLWPRFNTFDLQRGDRRHAIVSFSARLAGVPPQRVRLRPFQFGLSPSRVAETRRSAANDDAHCQHATVLRPGKRFDGTPRDACKKDVDRE